MYCRLGRGCNKAALNPYFAGVTYVIPPDLKECVPMMSSTHSGHPTAVSSEQHDEWLLDDAIDDTFPASDPVSHAQPGSTVNLRYSALESRALWKPRRSRAISGWLLLGSLVACTLLL